MSVNTYINGQLVRVSGSSTQTQSDAIQVAALPTASAQYEGKVYQYIGNDTETEKHGLFYGCIEENSEYKWVQVNTDPDTESISNEKLTAMWGSDTPIGPSIEEISRDNWNSLTTAEKQAKNEIIIIDSETGFERGQYVNGTDYKPLNYFIPNTPVANIDCMASLDNYKNGIYWGEGSRPIRCYYGSPSYDVTSNSVVYPTYTSGIIGYIDMENNGSTAFTAYIVGKCVQPDGRILISIDPYYNAGNALFIASVNGKLGIDHWGGGPVTNIDTNSDFVAAMRYAGNGNGGSGFFYNPSTNEVDKYDVTVGAVGRWLTLGRTSVEPNAQYPVPTDMHVKFLALVNIAETDSDIEANVANLYNEFLAT